MITPKFKKGSKAYYDEGLRYCEECYEEPEKADRVVNEDDKFSVSPTSPRKDNSGKYKCSECGDVIFLYSY